jgi:hypothetical protein
MWMMRENDTLEVVKSRGQLASQSPCKVAKLVISGLVMAPLGPKVRRLRSFGLKRA